MAANTALLYLVFDNVYIWAALRVLEVRDFEQRLMGLEQSVSPNNTQLALPIFDVEQDLLKPDDKEKHDSQ